MSQRIRVQAEIQIKAAQIVLDIDPGYQKSGYCNNRFRCKKILKKLKDKSNAGKERTYFSNHFVRSLESLLR